MEISHGGCTIERRSTGSGGSTLANIVGCEGSNFIHPIGINFIDEIATRRDAPSAAAAAARAFNDYATIAGRPPPRNSA